MNLYEKTIHKESIYKGAIIDLEVHDVELPDGNTSKRELVYHNGAVAICPVTPDNKVILVKQFRTPAEKPLLEIPAVALIVVAKLLMNKKCWSPATCIN